MKVLAAVILVVGSASALGSGPYLPSGWRPEGPAFELPVRPPVVIPPQDLILQGSGSDFLREYGPPKIQSLPEVATEQAFSVLAAKFSEEEKSEDNAEVIHAATEAVIDFKYDADALIATEAAVELSTEAVQEQSEVTVEGRSSNLEVEASLAEEVETNQESEAEVTHDAVVAQEESVEVKSSVSEEVKAELVEVKSELVEDVKTVEQEVKTVEEGVKNIAEAIVSLEKEAEAQEVQFSQDLTQIKSVEPISGFVQVPEGFLEYGPPGFREYGPPNQNGPLPRTANDVESEDEKIENNETRRRRFSPKFKSTKNIKKH